MLLSKIKELNEFTHKNPPQDVLVAYLSHIVAPLGAKSGVLYGQISDDHVITCEIAFGFPNSEIMQGYKFDLFGESPAAIAFRQKEITYFNIEEYERDHPEFPQGVVGEYKFAVMMPVGLTRIYGFKLLDEEEKISGIKEYFNAIRSILEIYHQLQDQISDGAN